MTIEECRAVNGAIRPTYQACKHRRQQDYAARVLQQKTEAAAHIVEVVEEMVGHAEGVETTPVDEFDAVNGDGEDLLNIHLPTDSVLSEREAALLAKFNGALEKIKFETCNLCLEEAFDLNIQNGICVSCRNDNAEPVMKWSDENNTQPGKSITLTHFGYHSLETFCQQKMFLLA